MSNENVTLIKELGIFLTIASEKQAYHTSDSQWVTLTYFGVRYGTYVDQGNNNCFALHDVS